MAFEYLITHETRYRYANPVTFGEHRAMFLPRPQAHGLLKRFSVNTSPPARVSWVTDALSNNVTVLEFDEGGTELAITFEFRGIHLGVGGLVSSPVLDRAAELPVQYTPDEWADLAMYLQPQAPDAEGLVADVARRLVAFEKNLTVDVIQRLMKEIYTRLTYQSREAEGTQTPTETLKTKSGTCRDYAWLMIEILRRLGLACRFVSGYLYDASLDGGEVGATGSGATHAWAQVFLPGAGWLNFDPTNRIDAGFDLIPVAVARHPAQAVPLTGSWFGGANDYQGMTVAVTITKLASLPDPTAG
ncbi:MAG: transglutaminase domain-containing protein [Pseudomonadales bacterium]